MNTVHQDACDLAHFLRGEVVVRCAPTPSDPLRDAFDSTQWNAEECAVFRDAVRRLEGSASLKHCQCTTENSAGGTQASGQLAVVEGGMRSGEARCAVPRRLAGMPQHKD